jgi:hypothetical protein
VKLISEAVRIVKPRFPYREARVLELAEAARIEGKIDIGLGLKLLFYTLARQDHAARL